MARCASCGAETELYHLGVPICPGCISDRDGVEPADDHLSPEVILAWERYREALESLKDHRVLDRDDLEDKAKIAREQYWEALRTYSKTSGEEEN